MIYLDDIQPVRARRTDPQTSHDAAKAAERFATTHMGRILAALKAHGPSTPAELADHTGLTVVQVCRRLPEAEAMRKAFPLGQRGGYRIWTCAA